LFHVVAVGTAEQLPVDAPDVVARHVWPVLGEIGRRAEVRGAVEAVDESFDDRLRQQLEVADPRQDGRIEERGRGRRDGGHDGYIPLFGTGTVLSSLSTISSVVIRSDSA